MIGHRALVVAVVVLTVAVSGFAGCAAEPAAILDEHGWTDHERIDQELVYIGIFDTNRWHRYLDASIEIGLDFEPWWGRDAHLLSYDLSEGVAVGQVLELEGRVIGAWLRLDNRTLPLSTDQLPRPSP